LLVKKVVLAYSGGLDTSVAVAWLKEQYGAEVIALTVDLGGGSLREGVAERAMSAGRARRRAPPSGAPSNSAASSARGRKALPAPCTVTSGLPNAKTSSARR